VLAITKVEDLLDIVGVDSPIAEVAVAVLALAGLTWGGVAGALKAGRWGFGLALSIWGKPEHRLRVRRRRLFAETVDGWLRDIDNKEDWSDHRFAELEAEVETLGQPSGRGLAWLRHPWRRSGLRRERSLSRSLARRRDPVILLEGDPGSGKSVALRHVARRLAARAIGSRRVDSTIPLYVNLKGLHAREGRVDGQLIEEFVLEQLQDGANRDVHRFLADEFGPGKEAGAWFFLFDSFDEIPAVLSATDVDDAVIEYSAALLSFMEGMNACRGVIASRSFRAPPRRDLPSFRIVPLSERRRRRLVRKSGLTPDQAKLAAELPGATADVVGLSSNPLFLGLLCDHVRELGALPDGWHDVFESYVSRRMASDADQVRARFGIGATELRRLSEEIAFTMTATQDLGLSPSRSALIDAYADRGFGAPAERLQTALDALEWIKLGRSDSGPGPSNPVFTFAHRRFQEYFATSIVLRDVDRIPAEELLTSASWRETTVTLFQSRLSEAAALLAEADARLATADPGPDGGEGRFDWQPGLLHLLGVLQSGFAGRTERLPQPMQERIWRILRDAFVRGERTDSKWVLEVAGSAYPQGLDSMLRVALQGGSDWLRDVAFRQAARMPEISGPLAVEVRVALVNGVGSRRLLWDWLAIKAQLLRLRPAAPFVNAARMLRARPLVDLVALSVSAALAYRAAPIGDDPEGRMALLVGLAIAYLLPPKVIRGVTAEGVEGFLRPYREVWTDGFWRRRPKQVDSTASELEMSSSPTMRHAPLGRELLRYVVVLAGVYGRLYLTFWPLTLPAMSLGGSLGITALLALVVWWGPTATLVSVRWPPRHPFAWLFPVVRAALESVAALRRVPLATYFYAAVTMALVVGALFGFMKLLGDGLAPFFSYGVAALALLLTVVRRLPALKAHWRDTRWYRRWSSSSPGLSGSELVSVLARLETSSVATRVVGDVRRRRLLKDDPDAEALVRDVLWAMARHRNGAVTAWRSPEFSSWAEQANGNGPAALRGFSDAVQDELGQLLEELQQSTELPSA
jgi:NACHT domain